MDTFISKLDSNKDSMDEVSKRQGLYNNVISVEKMPKFLTP